MAGKNTKPRTASKSQTKVRRPPSGRRPAKAKAARKPVDVLSKLVGLGMEVADAAGLRGRSRNAVGCGRRQRARPLRLRSTRLTRPRRGLMPTLGAKSRGTFDEQGSVAND